MDLHYAGVHQLSNIREFLYRLEAPGADPKMISVLADISLFAKHHLTVQHGPLLCLEKLSAELQSNNIEAIQDFCLTDDDVRHFAESHAPTGIPKKWAAK